MKERTKTWKLMVLTLLFCLLWSGSAFAKTYVYYGNRLSGFDRSAYKAMVKAARKGMGAADVSVPSGTTSYSLKLGDMMANDYPGIYWIKGYKLTEIYSTSGTSIRFKPIASWKNAYKSKAAFTKKVKAVVKKLKAKSKGKSTARKAKIIVDYLAKNCSYVESKYDQTAYAVFIKKKAICAGYARAYKLLCDELGIPCICVTGEVDGESHMINFVKIGKKWYIVDPTWCDNGSEASYDYFLLGKNDSGCSVTVVDGIRIPTLAAKSYTKY